MKQIQLEEEASGLTPEAKARFIRNLAREIRIELDDERESPPWKLAASIESSGDTLWALLEL